MSDLGNNSTCLVYDLPCADKFGAMRAVEANSACPDIKVINYFNWERGTTYLLTPPCAARCFCTGLCGPKRKPISQNKAEGESRENIAFLLRSFLTEIPFFHNRRVYGSILTGSAGLP